MTFVVMSKTSKPPEEPGVPPTNRTPWAVVILILGIFCLMPYYGMLVITALMESINWPYFLEYVARWLVLALGYSLPFLWLAVVASPFFLFLSVVALLGWKICDLPKGRFLHEVFCSVAVFAVFGSIVYVLALLAMGAW